LRLPLDGAPAATAPAAVDALFDADRARLAALSVLYVEDEPDIAESVQRLLASMGIRVDLNLGSGRDALELAAAQRRRPGGERVPVIVLSAYGTEDDHRATREAGVAAHLVKPVDPLQLARALLDASGRPGGVT
jgi:CheY-like chemotaxis protein